MFVGEECYMRPHVQAFNKYGKPMLDIDLRFDDDATAHRYYEFTLDHCAKVGNPLDDAEGTNSRIDKY